jgi:AbrB family looped-hinge helix DNA binding protein
MASTTLSTKGQLVLPRPVREFLAVHPGDKLDFLIRADGEVVVRPVVSDVSQLKGMLYRPDRKPVSLETMNAAIRQRGGRRP